MKMGKIKKKYDYTTSINENSSFRFGHHGEPDMYYSN